MTGTDITIMMDYTTFDHMPGNNSSNGTVKMPIVSVALQKAPSALGEDGILGLPGFEMALAIPTIAFVARRFKN